MNPEQADSVSMSFVDVITNGMGSMLVLFLLMTVLRQAVDLGAPHSPNGSEGEGGQTGAVAAARAPEKDPFVILVTSSGRRPLFAGQGQWDLSDEFGNARRNTGATFAAVYAALPPPAGATVVLRGARSGEVVTVQVWHKGAMTARTETPRGDGSVPVWPIPKEGQR